MNFLRFLLCLIVIGFLTACGQKGALYLPDQPDPALAQGQL